MGGFDGTPAPMQSLVFSLMIFLSFMSLGQAGVLCEKAQIHSLTMGESDGLCLKLDSDLEANERRVLEELIIIHENVARVLKVPVTELFSNPLNISLQEYVFGPFFSSANSFRLNLGVYPGEGYKINVGVYLHELGHVLAAAKNPHLPAIFIDLDNSVLFSETFADLLALSVHGDIITPDLEKGTCLDRLRYITTFQTYNYPQEYFQDFSSGRITKCCDSLMKKPLEAKYLNLCQAAQEFASAPVRMSQPFDPKNSKGLDDHQVGLPILSFFKNFAQKTNRSMEDIFGMIFFSREHSQSHFECELKKGDVVIERYPETLHTAEHMLNDFKALLPHHQIALYDSLFHKHALEKGIEFSRLNTQKAVKTKLIKTIINLPEAFEACKGKIDHENKKNCYLSCKSE